MEIVFLLGGWQGTAAICRCFFSNYMFLELLVDFGLFSNLKIALDVVHVHLCIVQSTRVQIGCLQ